MKIPKISDAKQLAEKYNLTKAIIIFVTDEKLGKEKLGYASYGNSKTDCDEAKKLADVAYDAILDELEFL